MYNSTDSDQSEDGELRRSPFELQKTRFSGPPLGDRQSCSNEMEPMDVEDVDSLDIKPPQASSTSLGRKRHSHHHHYGRSGEKYSSHKRSIKEQRYRDDDNRHYEERKPQSISSSAVHRHHHHYPYQHSSSNEHGGKRRRVEEKRVGDGGSGDRTLHDLRERLLSKRTVSNVRSEEEDEQEEIVKDGSLEDYVLQGESGQYVKEIIDISTAADDDYNDNSRRDQDIRRGKLLEAEREMMRIKEQSRIERERKRRLESHSDPEQTVTREFNDDSNTVIVSDISNDNSSGEEEEDSVHSSSDDKADDDEEDSASSSSSRSSETTSTTADGSVSGEDTSTVQNNGQICKTDSEERKTKKKIETKPELPPYYPAVHGCRSVEEFQCLNRIEEGTYGVVYRAKDKRTEDIVALKRLKMEKEKEGFPITSLREINTLLKGQHPNIVTVREIVVGSNMDKIFIVMDYVEHDLKSLMETMRHKKQTFMPGEIKCLLRQLLTAVAHLHDNWILHRDLKTSNLLLSHKGILKVGDFGLAREYGSPLKAYTPIVVTLWYRAPELLLCTKEYSTPIDMWSVGCIFAELLQMTALFPGKSEVDQLNRIFKDLGTPTERIWPGFNLLPAVQKMKFVEYPLANMRNKFHTLSESGLNLLLKFLTFDPVQRVAAEDAMDHAYFTEAPLPIDPAMFPTWPAKSELGPKRALAASPKPPSGGGEYKKLGTDADDDGYGFRIGAGLEVRRGGAGFSLKF